MGSGKDQALVGGNAAGRQKRLTPGFVSIWNLQPVTRNSGGFEYPHFDVKSGSHRPIDQRNTVFR
jgi:hypothetical protein